MTSHDIVEVRPFLPKQFLISQHRIDVPSGWRRTEWNGVFIDRSRDVPLVSVHVGRTIAAWFIGWFSDGARFFAADDTVHVDDIDAIDAIARRSAGRFVLVRRDADGISVQTDAVGLLPVVIDLRHGLAASSPAALSLAFPPARSDYYRTAALRTDGTTWYPFGLTPYANVERLLPNQHALLPAGVIRTVPRPPAPPSAETSRITESIFEMTVGHVRALAATGALDAHLTAGYDSRMVLAAAISARATADLITFRLPTKASELDCDIAARLASRINFRHRVIPLIPASASDRADWIQRTGSCIDDAVADLCETVRVNDTGRFTLTGSVGEVGRGFYWTQADLRTNKISADDLIKRLGFRPTQLLVEKAERWLNDFDRSVSVPSILDCAYIDHRLCGWAGPSSVGHLVNKPTISPLNSRSILSQVLSLPYKYRFSGSFSRDFISLGSDKLLSLPFNRGTGLRRLRYVQAELKALLPTYAISTIKRLWR